ncbi:HEPN domain-containing protein [bacterium]|nr:HEPN domain-containing protein [bacterium]
MSGEAQNLDLINYWLEKAHESLDSARNEEDAQRFAFAVNRLYYACFYAVSALLLTDQLSFRKHSGVRAAFHQQYIKSAQLPKPLGQLYDELFEARQRGDYLPFITFEKNLVKDWISRSNQFVTEITELVKAKTSSH